MARAFSLPPDPPLGSLWLRVLDPHAHSVYPGRAHYRHGLRVPLEEHLLLMAPPRTFKTAFLADVILTYPGPARPAIRSTGPTQCWPTYANESGKVHCQSPPGRTSTVPAVIALTRWDPMSRTVSLIMDPTTANITMFAVSAHAGDREAHVRGRAGRRKVARGLLRQTQPSGHRRPRSSVSARLRAVERAYRSAIEHDAEVKPEPAKATHLTEHVADREMEPE
jgi:hypothetical protein